MAGLLSARSPRGGEARRVAAGGRRQWRTAASHRGPRGASGPRDGRGGQRGRRREGGREKRWKGRGRGVPGRRGGALGPGAGGAPRPGAARVRARRPAPLAYPLTRPGPRSGWRGTSWSAGPGRPSRGPCSQCPGALLACGRAPGRALWPGPYGSASMSAAWVGPPRWTLRAGGNRRLIPRRRWTGPGGQPRLPDRASSRTPGRGGRARACVRVGVRADGWRGSRSGRACRPTEPFQGREAVRGSPGPVRCGMEQNGGNVDEGSRALLVIRFQGPPRMAECRRSDEVGPPGSRTSGRLPGRGYAPWPDRGRGGGARGRGNTRNP